MFFSSENRLVQATSSRYQKWYETESYLKRSFVSYCSDNIMLYFKQAVQRFVFQAGQIKTEQELIWSQKLNIKQNIYEY